MALLCSVAWLLIATWLIARAVRQNFAFRRLAPAAALSDSESPAVAIVVPARDEAENIGSCVSALTRQVYSKRRMSITVVDDHSSDMTARIVSALGCTDDRLLLLQSPPLPAGWTGKAHACWIGSRTAPAEAEWLCFVDADVRAGPMLMATAIAEASNRRLDFLSLTPRQELHSFAERLIMPCGFYMLAFCQDLVRIEASESGEAAATGQFILIRRVAYNQLGGHAAVRREICEDAALARLAKRSGLRVTIAGGDQLLATRMYKGWCSLWLGVSKNLVDMMGGPAATAITAILGVLLAWTAILLPLAEVIGCMRHNGHACLALMIALPASAAMIGLHMAGAAFFRIPVWYGLMFPLGYTAGALMALDSVRRRLSGRTVWKGRIYS
ncbi:MAG TPA: glycosyltransferase family A protein [Methylocella sp.]|nr:glycosyltransferase family A protein [Methylocella sp.]